MPVNYLDIIPATGSSQRLHDTSTRSLIRAPGLTGLPGVRGEPWMRPEEHGAVEPSAQFLPARIITLEGEIWGASVDAIWTDWNLVAAALYNTLSADATLKFQEGASGPQLQGSVRLASDVLPPIEGNGLILTYQVQLRAAYPFWVSQTLQTSSATGAPTSSGGIPFPIPFPIPFGSGVTGGSVTVTNGGTVPTWPTVTIVGPITSPAISNTTTGETLYLDGLVVTSAQTLVVVCQPPRSVTVSGTSVAGSIRWSDSKFPRLLPGSNQIQFTGGGTTAGTQMTVTWRDAYL